MIEEKLGNSTVGLPFASVVFPRTHNQSRSDCPPLNVYKAKEKGCAIVNLRIFVVKCNRMV